MRTEKQKHFFSENICRMLSLVLALVMMFSLLPAVSVAASSTVTVFFRNADDWQSVYGYAWDTEGKTLVGDWPGRQLTANTEGLYELTIPYSGTGKMNFIFNSGDGSQTRDLSLSSTQIASGESYWVNGGSGTPNLRALPTFKDGKVTFIYEGTASKVLLAGTMNGWKGVAMTKVGSTFTYTCEVPAGICEYKFVADGNWINDPRNPQITGADSNNYIVVSGDSSTVTHNTVTLHFQNTLGWATVCGSAWIQTGSVSSELEGWSWPGQALQKDADGNYLMQLQPELLQGQTLGYLFHDFNTDQTVNLSVSYATLVKGNVELWIKPTTAGDDGKYTCNTASTFTPSPKVEGNKVTFSYTGSATSVYVAGSFNAWSSTAAKMTKSGSTFTYTTTLADGIHQYKFVVNGSKWITDPANSNISSPDGNSVLIIGDTTANTDEKKITVQFHVTKTGSYSGWDAWVWSDGQDGKAYPLQTGTLSSKLVSVTVDSSCGQVGFILRKSDWSTQDDTYYVDLTKVASGTVHYFVDYAGTNGQQISDRDVVVCGSLSYAKMDYETNTFWVKTTMPMDLTGVQIIKASGLASGVTVTAITPADSGYRLSLSRQVTLEELGNLRIRLGSSECKIEPNGELFYSSRFANEYTYNGDDLGANWSSDSTTFKVWAPTAEAVSVMLYRSGNYGNNDWISTTPMKQAGKGVWEITVKGDLNGKYYNYLVQFPGYTCDATDPYAVTTGANGDRGMILNLDSTDPTGWASDYSPNQGMNFTDAIIYEMHIREMTIDSSSGVNAAWRGKYLGMTQTGTKYNGEATGLDHLKELGITHVQLMPTYDYNAVDEYHLSDWQQYAWGYDPRNYNVPEGSYATDPFKGEVRVKEFKQMVQAFHSNGINVIMDVVYNHAFSGGDFCYNKLVPNYFSRFWGDGSWSNGSGCGNDIATERAMTRNYIVDNIMHWVEEYHIDGFRFDLAGLIDTQTINEIVNTVHAKYPYVIFYGEGWGVGDTAVTPGYALANKGNAWQTPGFGYFNDDYRNAIAGDNGNSTGFASGAGDKADAIANAFRASNGWSTDPKQTINYVACHDNYSLMDKLCISRNGAYWDQLVRMNNLSAAIYMLSQGTPFIYSGEELLREKKNADGYRIDNAHDKNDFVNKIRWSDLKNKTYAAVTDDYYAGLIDFRKNHAALRCPNGSDAWGHVEYKKINDHCILFYLDGYPNYECSDGIVIIFNAQENSQTVNLGSYGVPGGTWQVCIEGDKAGTTALRSVTNGSVTVGGISTTVLVKGDLIHEESVYNNQSGGCRHTSHDQNGVCTGCGETVGHDFTLGSCTLCGKADPDYVAPVTEYYLFGYINGANYACEEDYMNLGEYKFVDGTVTVKFDADSYVGVKTGDNENWYMTQGWQGTDAVSVTLYNTANNISEPDKLYIPGGVEIVLTLVENGDDSLTLSCSRVPVGTEVGGLVTAAAEGTITLELISNGEVIASTAAPGKTAEYTFGAVAPGSYTLKVSMENHVTREYALTVGTDVVTQDVKICLIGDVSGDGRVNVGDVVRLYSYIRGTATIDDEYLLKCANVNGGSLNIGDAVGLYGHCRGTKKLY